MSRSSRAPIVGQAIAPPQSDIEIRVLRPEELDDLQWAQSRASERPEKDRLAGVVEAGDDERRHAAACADMVLPGGKEIEPLIGVASERPASRRRQNGSADIMSSNTSTRATLPTLRGLAGVRPVSVEGVA